MELFSADYSSPTSNFWLLAAVVLILTELLIIPGVGLLFGGLGALTLAAIMVFDIYNLAGWSYALATFFFFTIVWAVILWKPLKRIIGKKGQSFSNITGTHAIVEEDGGISQGKFGNVKWSGTLMRARIRPESAIQKIEKGSMVWIYENKNGILLIDVEEPKS